MLTVVQDHERSARSQELEHLILDLADTLESHGIGDRSRHLLTRTQRGEVHKEHTALKAIGNGRRRSQRQAGLTDPANSSQRHQPRLTNQPHNPIDIPITAH